MAVYSENYSDPQTPNKAAIRNFIEQAASMGYLDGIQVDTAGAQTTFEEGNLGKKTGKGYFEWPGGQRPTIDLSKATKKFNFFWPIFVQINEATKLIQEGVVDTLTEVDVALINSSGVPMAPISLGRQISKLDLIDNLEMLAARYEKPLFKPTRRVLEGGHKF